MKFILFFAIGVGLLFTMTMNFAHAVKDSLLKVSKALPTGAATSTSDAIDTGKATASGHQPGNVEYLLTAPAVTTTELPDTKTFTYNIIHSDNADLSSPSTMFASVIVQTGAGGAGAAGSTFRFRLASNAKRHIGFTAVGVATGAGSTATATLEGLA